MRAGRVFHADVRGTSLVYKGRPHALGIVRNIREEVAAIERLEARVAERTRELATLLEISRNVTSTLAVPELPQRILNQLKGVVDYLDAAVFTLEAGRLTFLDYAGPLTRKHAMASHHDVEPGPGYSSVIERREPVIIPDLWGGGPLPRAVRATRAAAMKESFGHIRSWMGVPLVVHDRLIGLPTLDHPEPDRHTAEDARPAQAFAQRAAIALENARLFAAEQRRVIGEIGSRITSILSVDELLAQTARLIRETFGDYHVHIRLIRGETLSFRTSRAAPGDESFKCCEAARIRVGVDGTTGWVAATGEPLWTPDVSRATWPPRATARGPRSSCRSRIFELRPESLEMNGLIAALER